MYANSRIDDMFFLILCKFIATLYSKRAHIHKL